MYLVISLPKIPYTVLTRDQCAPWFFMNCLSALRGVCAPLSVGKVCQLRSNWGAQSFLRGIAQTPSSKLAWLWITGTSIARVLEHCATHNELVHRYSHYWGHVRKERMFCCCSFSVLGLIHWIWVPTAPIHCLPRIITLINFAIAHNCAPALTGIISRLRTRLRTPISIVAKYSLRVSIAPKKIIKAQWSSVGTVYKPYIPKVIYQYIPKVCTNTIYIWFWPTLQISKQILLVVCRLLPPNHLIPTVSQSWLEAM